MSTTTKNTFRKHTPKHATRRNLDLLNVRHCKVGKIVDGIYTLTDIVKTDEQQTEFPLERYISEERLIGMCIGLGIGLIPVIILNILLWGNLL